MVSARIMQLMQNPDYWLAQGEEPAAIGADVGATNTKLVLLDETGRLLGRDVIPTPKGEQPEEITDAIALAVGAFRTRAMSLGHRILGTGFCMPQFSDGPDSIQRQANNMPALEGFPIRSALELSLGTPVSVVYDSTAAAIAEHRFGRGRGVSRLLTMSIGTGISIGVITESGIVDFNWGGTGDSGQIIVDPDATERCACGGRGCLESLAAAPAIRREALRSVHAGAATSLAGLLAATGGLEAVDVVRAAKKGDYVARQILERAGNSVGVALTSYLHIFRPELIVICGGMAEAGALLLEPIRRTVSDMANPWYLKRLQGIDISAFPRDGAAIGSAASVLDPDTMSGATPGSE
jgi:glucokinase